MRKRTSRGGCDPQNSSCSRCQPRAGSGCETPLHRFRSTKTRAEVTAEFLRSRDAVAAMTGEDSGSFHLSQQKTRGALPAATIAGQPANAQ